MPVRLAEQAPVKEVENEFRVRQRPERTERRGRVRTRVRWQVHFLGHDAITAIEGTTKDLSSKGFYCCSPIAFVPGECMVCVLEVPAYQPDRTGGLPLECKVRVVRVDPANGDGLYGIGCQIEDYRFLHV